MPNMAGPGAVMEREEEKEEERSEEGEGKREREKERGEGDEHSYTAGVIKATQCSQPAVASSQTTRCPSLAIRRCLSTRAQQKKKKKKKRP